MAGVTDFTSDLEAKVAQQLKSQRVGYLLGAGSSYLNDTGYPLAFQLWDRIKGKKRGQGFSLSAIQGGPRRYDCTENWVLSAKQTAETLPILGFECLQQLRIPSICWYFGPVAERQTQRTKKDRRCRPTQATL